MHMHECVCTELFVAGLALWEPILHLSILLSLAQWSPNFTLNLPAPDPFSQWHHRDPIILQLLISSLLSLTLSLCVSGILTRKGIFLLSLHALALCITHSVALSPSHVHTLICNVTRVGTGERNKGFVHVNEEWLFELINWSHRCHDVIYLPSHIRSWIKVQCKIFVMVSLVFWDVEKWARGLGKMN